MTSGVASVSFSVDQGGVDRLLHDPAGPYGQWLARVGNQAVNEAKGIANVRTGLMRSRIEFRVEVEGGSLVGLLAARTNYSLYVHEKHNPFLMIAVERVLAAQ